MHEIQIAQRVIDEAEKAGVKKKMIVEVGELAHISKEELEAAIKELCDYEIIVHGKESKVECNCGYIGKTNILDRGHGYVVHNCPKCEGKVEIVEGSDIRLIGVE